LILSLYTSNLDPESGSYKLALAGLSSPSRVNRIAGKIIERLLIIIGYVF
jgi:hypothetical protein